MKAHSYLSAAGRLHMLDNCGLDEGRKVVRVWGIIKSSRTHGLDQLWLGWGRKRHEILFVWGFCLCSMKECGVLFGLEDGLFEQLPIQHRTKRTSANWTIILLNIQLLNIHLSRNYKIIVEKMNVKKLNVELTICWIGILGNWLDGKSQMLNWLFVQYFLVNMTCSNAFVGSTGHRLG